MVHPAGLHEVAPVALTESLVDDVGWLAGELDAASPGRESDLMRLLLSRVAFNNMFQFCAFLDVHGTMWDVNSSARIGAGLSRIDIHGKPFWEARWWQSAREAPTQLRAAIARAADGEFIRYDVDIIGRDCGTQLITIDFNIQPVKDAQGVVRFLICEGRDVSTQRRLERETQRQREELAALDALKTQFFASVSHEFRTPLTLMIGPVQEALGDAAEALGPVQRERLEMVERNGRRLGKLVNTLLDFSRVEAGRAQSSYRATDLATVTRELASSFGSACANAGVALVIEAPPLGRPVYVDRDMWEKIVLNLVSNAFKFTFEGAITVRVAAEGEAAVLSVCDTGTGVPEADLPLLFDRFHRVEGARGRSHEGSGIGLSLVRELVRLHGGSVAVASLLGHGTQFTVRVPFGEAHLPAGRVVAVADELLDAALRGAPESAFASEAADWGGDEAADAAADGSAGSGASTWLSRPGAAGALPGPTGAARARVLLVDCNADMRRYLARLLASGYEVTAVNDGAAALVSARQGRPDLILSDVMMPGIDGYALLDAVRGDAVLREVPIILLSAKAGDEAKVEGLQRGADDYLVKPFSARELLARVGANIELARMRLQGVQDKELLYAAAQSEIAQARKVEAALRQSEETLESKVAERTRQLDERTRELTAANVRLRAEAAERGRVEEALRQSHKMEAIGQLTGGIAHDFNNLLAGISGSLELLRLRAAEGRTGEFGRYIEAGLNSTSRASALTQRLLAFSRRQTLDPTAIDPNRLVLGMDELCRRTVGPGIRIEMALVEAPWLALCDANQLENALLNLVINARDATPDGGSVRIVTDNLSIAAGGEDGVPAGDYVVLSVADTGIGMSPAVAMRAFDPFFTTKAMGQGTGLGLSMIHGFVQQSGGHVRLHSRPGEGTTVVLYLPRRIGSADAAGAAAVAAGEQMAEGAVVLVVEDEPAVRMVIIDALADRGYTALEAENGRAGLSVLQSQARIDLLVTDIGLPGGMTGQQLAEAAQRLRPALKVLFITGYAEGVTVGDRAAGREIEFMTKPFQLDALADRVGSMIAA